MSCDVVEPAADGKAYDRDPLIVKRAGSLSQGFCLGDTAFFQPEPEFSHFR
jgi:hypothetical protein